MLHYTRLMREGEVALWRGGKIVWQGAVGTIIDGVAFDAVSLNVEDGRRLSHRLSAKTITANEVRRRLQTGGLTGIHEAPGKR
jgi:hypothetical protein